MANRVSCVRCGRSAPQLDAPPIPSELGRVIQEKTCARCWEEWTETEVKVINELRLNLTDPKAHEILERHMREFLGLDPLGSTTE